MEKLGARVGGLARGLPYPAMLQKLGTLTALGVIAPQSEACSLVVARVSDRRRIQSAKMHPLALLDALIAYRQGHSSRGKVAWSPVPDVIDALDEAFYIAFENVQPSGTRVYLALDAGDSCRDASCHGMQSLAVAVGAAVMAMAFARTERRVVIEAFHERSWRIEIGAQDRLERACQAIAHESKDSDASLPFKSALRRGLKIDAFVVITDQQELDRRKASRARLGGVSSGYRNSGQARSDGHGREALLSIGSERCRTARSGRLRPKRAEGTQRFSR